jgi:hypothetical protein
MMIFLAASKATLSPISQYQMNRTSYRIDPHINMQITQLDALTVALTKLHYLQTDTSNVSTKDTKISLFVQLEQYNPQQE